MPKIGTNRKFGDDRKGVASVSALCEIMIRPSILEMRPGASPDWGSNLVPMKFSRTKENAVDACG